MRLAVLAGVLAVLAVVVPRVAAAGTSEHAYTEMPVASQAITATNAVTAQTVVCTPSTTFDDTTQVVVHAFVKGAYGHTGSAGGAFMFFTLQLDSTVPGGSAQRSEGDYESVNVYRRLMVNAGAHTFCLKAYVTGGAGSVVSHADLPSFIRVTTSEPEDDAVSGGGAGGVVELSGPDRDRLDLVWWGVWFLVGSIFVLMCAPMFEHAWKFWREA